MCRTTIYHSRTCSHRWICITQPCGYLAHNGQPLGFNTCPKFHHWSPNTGIDISCRSQSPNSQRSRPEPPGQYRRNRRWNEQSPRVWAPLGTECIVCNGKWNRGEVDTNNVMVVSRIVDGVLVGREGCGVGCVVM